MLLFMRVEILARNHFFSQMNPMANELPTGDGWLADAREFDEGDVDDAYCAETEPNSDDEMELESDEDVVEEDDSPVGDDEDQPDSGGEDAADEPGGPQPSPGSLCSLFYFYFYSFPFSSGGPVFGPSASDMRYATAKKNFNCGQGNKNPAGKVKRHSAPFRVKRRAVEMLLANVEFEKIRRKIWDVSREKAFTAPCRGLPDILHRFSSSTKGNWRIGRRLSTVPVV